MEGLTRVGHRILRESLAYNMLVSSPTILGRVVCEDDIIESYATVNGSETKVSEQVSTDMLASNAVKWDERATSKNNPEISSAKTEIQET